MSTQWVRHDLLPGPTVFQWSGYALMSCALGLVGMIGALVCAVTIVSASQQWDPVTITFLALLLLGFAGGWVLNKLSDRKGRAELAAGYTTSAQGNNEVIRLHSRTGVVMREAGQPNLTKPQWEAAMARVRAYEESVANEPPRGEGEMA